MDSIRGSLHFFDTIYPFQILVCILRFFVMEAYVLKIGKQIYSEYDESNKQQLLLFWNSANLKHYFLTQTNHFQILVCIL